MPRDVNLHHRRSIRLPNWNYRERGAYFVTICTHERTVLFENTLWRELVEDVWRNIVSVGEDPPDEFVVMPNHVHGIIWLPGTNAVGAQQPQCLHTGRELIEDVIPPTEHPVVAPLQRPDAVRRVESGSLAAIVRTFKAATAKRINNLRDTPGAPVWQRNFYEPVIRDGRELDTSANTSATTRASGKTTRITQRNSASRPPAPASAAPACAPPSPRRGA